MSKTKPKLSDETAVQLPVIDCPDFRYSTSERWKLCPECKEQVWKEFTGHEYYHRISCSKSNGIRYRADRGTT